MKKFIKIGQTVYRPPLTRRRNDAQEVQVHEQRRT